jgi:predicted restriction endonuclease
MAALCLYHNLTFGQLHSKQPVIIEFAERLGRSSGSVAMKLCNFASLDPVLKLRGIKGLIGTSALDREVWADFHENQDEVVSESREILRHLFAADADSQLEVIAAEGIRLKKADHDEPVIAANLKYWREQEYFRDVVLNNFGGRCGITGIPLRELLVASHIVPARTHPQERLNVRNGLCLSRLHNAAFDSGLITFDEGLRLVISSRLETSFPQKALAENFHAYVGEPLKLPEEALIPEAAFLEEHRRNIFKCN